MKRVLILGSTGMLGSRLAATLVDAPDIDVTITGRYKAKIEKFNNINFREFDAVSNDVEYLIRSCRPDFIINAMGWIKQKKIDRSSGIIVNSLIPCRLAELSEKYNFKLIHFSTDCVFDGSLGNYTTKCVPSPLDFYGQTKLLGEISGPNIICIRTSIIGYELGSSNSLLEWIMKQHNTITGYSEAIFSGVSTNELSKLVNKIVEAKFISGLYHVSSEPISKLGVIRHVLKETKIKCKVIEDHSVKINRSLKPNYSELGIDWHPMDWSQKISNVINEGRLK